MQSLFKLSEINLIVSQQQLFYICTLWFFHFIVSPVAFPWNSDLFGFSFFTACSGVKLLFNIEHWLMFEYHTERGWHCIILYDERDIGMLGNSGQKHSIVNLSWKCSIVVVKLVFSYKSHLNFIFYLSILSAAYTQLLSSL